MKSVNKKNRHSKPGEDSSQKKYLMALLDHPEVQSWRALMGAFKFIFSHLEKGLVSAGCSVSRFQILFYLYLEEQLPAVEIARRLVVTRGNISMFLRRMESDGLVSTIVPDGKKRPVYCLTKNGRTLFEEILPSHIKRVRNLAPKLDKRAIQQLRSISKY